MSTEANGVTETTTTSSSAIRSSSLSSAEESVTTATTSTIVPNMYPVSMGLMQNVVPLSLLMQTSAGQFMHSSASASNVPSASPYVFTLSNLAAGGLGIAPSGGKSHMSTSSGLSVDDQTSDILPKSSNSVDNDAVTVDTSDPNAMMNPNLHEMKRKKHNLLEVKRRRRLTEKFQELQELIGSRADQRSILQSAIENIQNSRIRVKELENQLQSYKEATEFLRQQQQQWTAKSQAPMLTLMQQLEVVRMGKEPASKVINFQQIYELVTAPIGIMAIDGRFVDCNDAMCILLGRSKSEIVQSTMFGLANTQDLATMFSKVRRLIKGEESLVVFEMVCMHAATKTAIPLMVSVYAVRDQHTIHSLLWLAVKSDQRPVWVS